MRQPAFLVACVCAALGYGVMNLLMAATPLAMQQCGLSFNDTALVLEWHVIGMFAPGFFTGNLIKRWGTLPIMAIGLVLNLSVRCYRPVRALSCTSLLSPCFCWVWAGISCSPAVPLCPLDAYRPEEKDRAQAALNFSVFAVTALTIVSVRRPGHDPRLGLAECRITTCFGDDCGGIWAGWP